MPRRSLSESLGRVLVASAWTDGELGPDERRAMEDLLFSLPGLSIDAWRQLEQDMKHPLSDQERAERVRELQRAIGGQDDLELCRGALQALAGRTSPLGQDDRAAINDLMDQLAAPADSPQDRGLLGRLSAWLRAPLKLRALANADHRERQRRFQTDVREQILEKVRARLGWNPHAVELEPAVLDRICLSGAILARIAHADDKVTDDEFDHIRTLLKEHLGDDLLSASIVTEIVVSEVASGLDTYALIREFFQTTTEEEKLEFLDLMFAVAVADGHVSTVEMEEIRIVSQTMLLSHRQFIDAKLKIPKQRRDS